MTIEQTAKMLWTEYCKAVGGFAHDGFQLPSWEDFAANPEKQVQVNGWRKVAEKALLRIENENAGVLQIARTCHEVNTAFSVYNGEQEMPSWNDLPSEIQDSAIHGVKLKLENDLTPEQQHEEWCKFKTEQGWVYGETKDMDSKTHPCLVPYSKLPESQKFKDKLFQAVIKSF